MVDTSLAHAQGERGKTCANGGKVMRMICSKILRCSSALKNSEASVLRNVSIFSSLSIRCSKISSSKICNEKSPERAGLSLKLVSSNNEVVSHCNCNKNPKTVIQSIPNDALIAKLV
jgi:hypothetical protein